LEQPGLLSLGVDNIWKTGGFFFVSAILSLEAATATSPPILCCCCIALKDALGATSRDKVSKKNFTRRIMVGNSKKTMNIVNALLR
jgi:hypothetical protein